MGERILIVLDTHIFLWLTLQPERIPSGILTAISNEKTLGIPAISMWEADRLIAATAIEYDCPLATVDSLLFHLPMLKFLP
jgi:PIN domain nuclease of toxin-antitoxin system